jgi:hypothetical protein
MPHFTIELLRQHLDRAVRRARTGAVGERTLADAPRDEGAEREDEKRRYRFAAEAN